MFQDLPKPVGTLFITLYTLCFVLFLMWTISTIFIGFVTILLLFYVWFFVHKACGILAL